MSLRHVRNWIFCLAIIYLWCNNLNWCHKAICDDWHTQEHVHQGDEIDDSTSNLVPKSRVIRLPHRQDDTWFTCHCLTTTIRTGISGQKIIIWLQHCGRNCRLFLFLGLRSAGWKEEKKEAQGEQENNRAERRCHSFSLGSDDVLWNGDKGFTGSSPPEGRGSNT